MKHYTQRELMNEGLWDKFKSKAKGVGSQIVTATKEIAKTVAPEIYDPLKKMNDWEKNFRKKIGQAGRGKDQRAIQLLLKNSLFPLSKSGNPNDAKINWIKDEDEPEIEIGSVRVGKAEVIPTPDGKNKFEKVADFPSAAGRNLATVYFNNDTKQISIGKTPYSRNIQTIQVQQGAQQGQQQGQQPPP